MILILAHDTTFGNAHLVKQALGDAALVVYEEEQRRPEAQAAVDAVLWRDMEVCRSLVGKAGRVLIVGASAFRILDDLDDPPLPETEVWYTDSSYLRYSRAYNERAREMGVKRIFAMPDLMHLAPEGAKPLLHPIPLSLAGGQKADGPKVVAHSPGTTEKRAQKGSARIEAALDGLRADYDFVYDCIMGQSHADCLKRKAQAHIFVDKLLAVDGPSKRLRFGLGKSGLEAMALGCVTLCALPVFEEGHFDRPPVLRVNDAEDLDMEMRRLLEMDFGELAELGAGGRAWIEKWWGLENGAWLRYYESLLRDGR